MTDPKGLEKQVAELTAQQAELKAEIERLKPKVAEPPKPTKPWTWQKPDYTAQMGMPASAVKAMVDAVPDFRGIAAEQRRGVAAPGGFGASVKPQGPVERGTGWSAPRAIEPPPGVSLVDAIASSFETLDRLEQAKRLADLLPAGAPAMEAQAPEIETTKNKNE
jgi:hypothetical protein